MRCQARGALCRDGDGREAMAFPACFAVRRQDRFWQQRTREAQRRSLPAAVDGGTAAR
jgi:hypothetical protein